MIVLRPNESGLTRFLRLIRFSHTVFALPFALGALLVATHGQPSLRLLTLVLLCMVCARTAAMLFNRLADWTLDQRNPRTAMRHQLISRPVALLLLGLSSVAFVAAAAAINQTTLLLAPLALSIIFFYSLTKRFTAVSHFFLGGALAIAPAGAWIAASGRLTLAPLLLSAGVAAWVTGSFGPGISKARLARTATGLIPLKLFLQFGDTSEGLKSRVQIARVAQIL